MTHPTPRRHPLQPADSGAGRWLVIGLVGLAVAGAGFAVWFQWRQTRRCLGFYGPHVARSVQAAPRVELWELVAGPDGRIVRGRVQDVSVAPGLVHLRHGLVEDANFDWAPADGSRLPASAWDVALAFYAAPDATQAAAVLAIDLTGDLAGDGGTITAVGRPGRVRLGRIAAGLGRWITATAAAPSRTTPASAAR